ncbi:MAG: GNAT family N-acetyltransferase [Anaerolineae bacterium]|nr:GNAT family N-acetyltransferase [Anaerolineae bacterium]
MLKIVPADTTSLVEQVVVLAQEYVTWMLAEIHERNPELDVDLFAAAHDYDDVRKKIPGDNVPPFGRMFLALDGDRACGCIALGKLSATVGEMRTLFVRPSCRGAGTGRQLVEALLREARQIGYTHLRLDTLRFMDSAIKLYQSLGFYDIAPYGEAPDGLKPYIRFLEVDLSAQ